MDERPMMARTLGVAHDEDALQELALSELVSRVLDRGVVVSGEVVISVAGVDLVYLGLDLLLTSVESVRRRRDERASGA